MKKKLRKFFRKVTRREFLYKAIILVSTIALIATAILPYLLIR